MKVRRLASQVEARRATVVIRKDNGSAIVCTGEIVGHMLNGFDDEAARENDVTFVEVSDEDLKTDRTWQSVLDRAEEALNAKAAYSVVMPKARLLDILDSVDTALIRLDILPGLFGEGNEITHIVNGDEYISSICNEYIVDALRVVEVKGAPDKLKLSDSMAAIGCVHVKSFHFEDEKKQKEMNTPPKRKRRKFGRE